MENGVTAEYHFMSAAGEGVNTNQNIEGEEFGMEGNASEKHEELCDSERHDMSAAGEGVDTNQNIEGEKFGIEGNSSEKHEEIRDSMLLLFFNDTVIRDSERLLFFNDAVFAIASTLLILPLMEAATDEEADSDKETVTAVDYFINHGYKLFGFTFNFVMVFGFWVTHAFAMAHVEFVTPLISVVNHTLMVAIVFLPVTTPLVWSDDYFTTRSAIYFAVILLIDVLMVLLKLTATRDPRVWSKYGAPTFYDFVMSLVKIVVTTIAILVAHFAPESWIWFPYTIVTILPGVAMEIIQSIYRMEKNEIDVLVHRYSMKALFFSLVYGPLKKFIACFTTDDLQVQNVDGEGNDYIDMFSERLIIFTDGTTAISITLLSIPLMEHASDNMSSFGTYVTENGTLILLFLNTYMLVLSEWNNHDGKFRFIEEKVPATFLFCSALWILTIAFAPVATVLLAINNDDGDTMKSVAFVTIVIICTLISFAMSLIVFRECEGYQWQEVFKLILSLVLVATGIPVTIYSPSIGPFYVVFVKLPAYLIAALLAKRFPRIESFISKIA